MAHTHGSVPVRRSAATRPAVGSPRSASIRTVESRRRRATESSANASGVAPTLRPHPSARVVVPLVLRAPERAERGFDVVPSLLVLEAAPDELGDEGASLTRAHPSIQRLDQFIVQRYVHTHGLTLAHRARPATRHMAELFRFTTTELRKLHVAVMAAFEQSAVLAPALNLEGVRAALLYRTVDSRAA